MKEQHKRVILVKTVKLVEVMPEEKTLQPSISIQPGIQIFEWWFQYQVVRLILLVSPNFLLGHSD